MSSAYHVPVLLKESVDALVQNPDGLYVDVTFGGGGHSREILARLSDKGRLVAFDQDPDAQRNLIDDSRFQFVDQNFAFIKNNLRLLGYKAVDGILADLGVSSHQFNEPSRGFSIRFEADLDMRMDKQRELTAAKVLNTYSEEQLHKIFGWYGEVQNAKSLAHTIARGRVVEPIVNLTGFKSLIAAHIPKGKENKYMAQVFQALRIEVNGELEVLGQFLEQSADLIKKGGRLVVISYHSLEDRPVKNFLTKGKLVGDVEKDFYGNEIKPFKALNRKAITASSAEIEVNNRSRSAKLRIAERL